MIPPLYFESFGKKRIVLEEIEIDRHLVDDQFNIFLKNLPSHDFTGEPLFDPANSAHDVDSF